MDFRSSNINLFLTPLAWGYCTAYKESEFVSNGRLVPLALIISNLFTDYLQECNNVYVEILTRNLAKRTKVAANIRGCASFDQLRHFPVTVSSVSSVQVETKFSCLKIDGIPLIC